MQAYGSFKGGEEAADLYEDREKLARVEADYQRKKAKIEEYIHYRDLDKTISRMRAIQGHSGTVPDSGSNLEALKSIEKEGEFDAALIRWMGDINAQRAEYGAQTFQSQAELSREAGYIGAAGTILQGLGQYDYRRFQPAGGGTTSLAYNPARYSYPNTYAGTGPGA
jgi:hypothetical protein